jgi:hypothetical protein
MIVHTISLGLNFILFSPDHGATATLGCSQFILHWPFKVMILELRLNKPFSSHTPLFTRKHILFIQFLLYTQRWSINPKVRCLLFLDQIFIFVSSDF